MKVESAVRELEGRRKEVEEIREDKVILLGIARFLANAPLDEDEDEASE